MEIINQHFSRITHKYRYLRTTDSLLLPSISKKLENLTKIEAANVSCGAGTYADEWLN